MPDTPDLPIDDDPPAELDPLATSKGEGDQDTVDRLAGMEDR